MGTEDALRSDRDVEYIFVYGTLRKDAGNKANQILAKHSRCVGNAKFQGKLFDLGDYPGAVPSGDPRDIVYGEVYALEPPSRDAVLTLLDEYEGCSPKDEAPAEFRRERVTITLESGSSVSSWIYLHNWAEANAPIPSGDYARYLETKWAGGEQREVPPNKAVPPDRSHAPVLDDPARAQSGRGG